MRTALWAGAAALVFILLLAAAEGAARRWSLPPEVGRKLAHVSCGLLAALLPLALPFWAIATLAAIFVPFMMTSRRLGLFPVLHSAERSTFGEMYFPIGILLVAIFVPHRVEYAFGVLVLAIADALAGIMGRRFGKRSYQILGSKTYVGSTVFLVTAFALGLLAVQVLGDLSGRTILVALAVAAATTFEEGLVGGGVDNVILPISAAAMLEALT
jgi:phytol kinase